MRKATLMNQMRKAKQAGDKEEEARLRDQLARYKRERKAQRGIRRTYRVKRGDNYFSIAEDVYGDARYAIRLAQANKGLYQLYQGMILQLPPKDEEEPLITDKEMEGLGGTGGDPETTEMAEFNDAVTRYGRSQPVYTQPDDTTATAPQPAQSRSPRLRWRKGMGMVENLIRPPIRWQKIRWMIIIIQTCRPRISPLEI